MEVAAILKAVTQSWILFLVVFGSIVMSPMLLLANMSPVVGQIYYWAMFAFVERFWLKKNDHKIRVDLFAPLADECKKRLTNGSTLRVLEIGPGTGGNFGYYPSGVSLTTLEQNPHLQKHAASIRKDHPHLKIEKTLVGSAEKMTMIPDKTFDAVVGTHVLCCIKDKELAVREIRRILKDVSYLLSGSRVNQLFGQGGKLYSSEIVCHSKKEWQKRLVQRAIAPFWSFFTLGCTAGNFDPIILLTREGFDVSAMEEYNFPDGPPTHSRNLYGPALKKPSA